MRKSNKLARGGVIPPTKAQANKMKGTLDYPSTDRRSNRYANPNEAFMYPQLNPATQQGLTGNDNALINAAMTIPGFGQLSNAVKIKKLAQLLKYTPAADETPVWLAVTKGIGAMGGAAGTIYAGDQLNKNTGVTGNPEGATAATRDRLSLTRDVNRGRLANGGTITGTKASTRDNKITRKRVRKYEMPNVKMSDNVLTRTAPDTAFNPFSSDMPNEYYDTTTNQLMVRGEDGKYRPQQANGTNQLAGGGFLHNADKTLGTAGNGKIRSTIRSIVPTVISLFNPAAGAAVKASVTAAEKTTPSYADYMNEGKLTPEQLIAKREDDYKRANQDQFYPNINGQTLSSFVPGLARGGMINQPTGNGAINKTSMKGGRIQGPRHEQGGVNMGNKEVEGGEVAEQEGTNTRVYSDRLMIGGKTIADIANGLLQQRGTLERKLPELDKKLTTKGSYRPTSNGIKRTMSNSLNKINEIDTKLDQLFVIQDQMNGEEEQQQLAYGGVGDLWGKDNYIYNNDAGVEVPYAPVDDFSMDNAPAYRSPNATPSSGGGWNTAGQVAEAAYPFIDNAVNAYLTSKTPKIPVPRQVRAPQIETNVNIDANRQAIRNNLSRFNRAVDANTASSNVALGRKQSALATGIDAENTLLTNKLNTERGLRNQQSQLNTQAFNMNQGQMSKYDTDVAARQFGIYQDISKNLAEGEADFTEQLTRRDFNRFQSEQLQYNAIANADYNSAAPGILKGTEDRRIMTDTRLAQVYYDIAKKGGTAMDKQVMARILSLNKKVVE